MYTEKRVLITGGAGFLGSFLCEKFLSEGWFVLCMDNFFTGKQVNVAHLLSNPKFELLRWDVTEPRHIDATLILNFACPASPIHYQHDPIKTLKTSVLGGLNLLELARSTKAVFLQASTSEIYGDPEVNPQPETYWGNVNTIGIRSCYDEGKRVLETMCSDFKRCHNVDARMVRIFNTYGPRMSHNDGRVVSNFVVQALTGQDITLNGTGNQTRSFCFVTDLVEGIYRAATVKTLDGPVNLGNPAEFTVKELAELVIKQTGSRSKLVFRPLPQDDPKVRKPDITRAKTILGWEPKIPLAEGLIKTVEYFKSTLG